MSGVDEKAEGVENRRESISETIEAKEQEIKKIYRYFKERPDIILEFSSELENLEKDPGIQRAFRRHSDQFRLSKENRLSHEIEKNKKLRLIHKFKKEHAEIEDITNQWRDILLRAFGDLIKYTGAQPQDLYKGFHLRSIQVEKEEVGIYSEDEENPTEDSR